MNQGRSGGPPGLGVGALSNKGLVVMLAFNKPAGSAGISDEIQSAQVVKEGILDPLALARIS